VNAAIYARKSTEQNGRATEQKSVERQVALAREFAAARGLSVAADHVFVDDGISGAEFERRPGFMQMMGMLHPRAPFQVLIVSEQKSIGRESSETNYRIKQLAEAGVEIIEYVHGRSLTPKNWIDKVTAAVLSSVDEGAQRQASERSTETARRKFLLRHVVGGRVFGYRNEHVYAGHDASGNPLRSHTVRKVHPEEAPVVRRIFELFDSGVGLKGIAKQLNSEQAVRPKPFVRKSDKGVPPVNGWSPSTVRTILSREIYRGVVVWNKSRKRTDWGKVKQQVRPESEWMRLPPDESLRIVPDDLWQRVAARRAETEGRTVRFASGRLSGRPPKHATQNLLAGLATCAVCGGGLVVETSGRKTHRVQEYVCHRYKNVGTCTNALRVPAADMNEDVLQAIEEHALTPEAIEQVILLTERDDQRERKAAIEREAKDVARRIARVLAAIETDEATPAASLRGRLRELEARQETLARELASLAPVPRLPAAVIEDRLAEWRRLLRQSTTQARAVLQRVLRGRITFTPVGNGYRFTAPTRFDKLFTGVASPRPAWMPTTVDSSPGVTAADTLDGDYGRVLARAAERILGKGLASPAGFEPAFWP
jgi:site-specific DNA recombinase